MTCHLRPVQTCVVKRWLHPIICVAVLGPLGPLGPLGRAAEKGTAAFTAGSRPRLAFDRFAGVSWPVRAVDSSVDSEVADFVEDDELMAMLMSGTGDEVDILGNGSLIKTIIQPAPAFSRRPQLGDEVTVHFVP